MKNQFEYRYFNDFDAIKSFANSRDVTIVQVMPLTESYLYDYVVFYYITEETSKN